MVGVRLPAGYCETGCEPHLATSVCRRIVQLLYPFMPPHVKAALLQIVGQQGVELQRGTEPCACLPKVLNLQHRAVFAVQLHHLGS